MVPVYVLIQALIGAYGSENFQEEFSLFVSPNEVVIARLGDAELSEEFREKLTRFLKMSPKEVKLIEPTDFNFRGMDPRSIEGFIRDTAQSLLQDIPAQVQGSKALIEFTLEIDSGSKDAKRLKSELTNVPELPNVRIAFKDDKSFTYFRSEDYQESVSVARLQTGRPDRDTIITADDHLNLKIALETAMSVDDFIAMM